VLKSTRTCINSEHVLKGEYHDTSQQRQLAEDTQHSVVS
jgi:hypothetical protein